MPTTPGRRRALTTTLGATGAVLTGALAGFLAHGSAADATTPAASGGVTTTDGASSSTATGGFAVPGTLPGGDPSGSGGHASSGGS